MRKVFVDSAIFRYASSVKVVWTAQKVSGHITSKEGVKHEVDFIYHNTDIRNPFKVDEILAGEIECIQKIANAAKNRLVYLCHSHEINLELMFQPEVDIAIGRMHGAPCNLICSPLLVKQGKLFAHNDTTEYPLNFWSAETLYQYGPPSNRDFLKDELFRVPVSGIGYRLNFRAYAAHHRIFDSERVTAPILMQPALLAIQSERFIEIGSTLSVYSCNDNKRPNMLMDAYHLFTAEIEKCDFFLTTDTAILNQFKSDSLVAIKPSTLVSQLNL